jgi:hypothetical protein
LNLDLVFSLSILGKTLPREEGRYSKIKKIKEEKKLSILKRNRGVMGPVGHEIVTPPFLFGEIL